ASHVAYAETSLPCARPCATTGVRGRLKGRSIASSYSSARCMAAPTSIFSASACSSAPQADGEEIRDDAPRSPKGCKSLISGGRSADSYPRPTVLCTPALFCVGSLLREVDLHSIIAKTAIAH